MRCITKTFNAALICSCVIGTQSCAAEVDAALPLQKIEIQATEDDKTHFSEASKEPAENGKVHPLPPEGLSFQYTAIPSDQIQPGDIVIFRMKASSVLGVYLGNGRFVHAIRGNVRAEDALSAFWRARYCCAVRVVGVPQREPLGRPKASKNNRLDRKL